jgi:hypothetical protein
MDEQIEEEKGQDRLTPAEVNPKSPAGEHRDEAPIEKSTNGV